MIKSLIKRTEDAINHAASELEQVKGINRKANYNKLLEVLREGQRIYREIALEADKQKDQYDL